MNRKNILVVTKQNTNEGHLAQWTGTPHPFHVNMVNNHEEAIEKCHVHHYDVVVVDGTDDSIDNKKLNAVLPILLEDATVIKYEGESADKLTENIEAVFNAKRYQRVMRMMMLEASGNNGWNNLPQFSLN
jgi:hypothetical protein